MKFFNKDTRSKMLLIFFGVFTWWVFVNIKLVGLGIGYIFQALSPIIIGLIIAFILNSPMVYFENKIFYKLKLNSKWKRLLSLVITIIVFILLALLILIIIIPNLIDAGLELKNKLPQYLNSINQYIKSSFIKYPGFDSWLDNLDLENINDRLSKFVKGGLFDIVGSTFTFASSMFGNIISALLGFIFSIYFLLDKENLLEGLKKFLYSVFPLQVSDKVLYITHLTKKAFSNFLLAQSLEAVIIGLIFFVAMTSLSFPYASMISVVITVFSLIPVVGSFIGLFVGVILIFVESPKLAGLFIILFLILQQIEGNLIYPRVVGKFSGLSPLLTLIAVTLGGSLMGVVGIILFIPLFAIIQVLMKDFMDGKS